ncbi:YidB family protein [Castellaniella sp.]|uniref:YidB family protein n=1 Tax=Castellaniella sp. TaxID=1955812 RepID=UPI002AFF4E51|nr:YidB family protein [Castellaniella sp.]
MGLFDGLAGQMIGKILEQQGGTVGRLFAVAQDLVQQNGGLAGLLKKFQEAGFDEQVTSWLGDGENLPITQEQVLATIGQGPIADLAEKFGLSSEEISSGLAQWLPEAVNHLSENGKLID